MSSTSPTSSLSTSNDFAAELLLNRIMNGQLKADSGKTVTAGSRALAARLDTTAQSYGSLSSNVAAAQTLVQGAQDAVTEMISQLKYYTSAISNMDVADAKALWTDINTNLTALLATVIDDGSGAPLAVLGSTGKAVSLGLGTAETTTVGGLDVASGTAYSALTSGVSGATATSDIQSLCDDAIDELYGVVTRCGAQANLLANRYDMLNDLATTYHTASDEQATSTGGSASSLLNALL